MLLWGTSGMDAVSESESPDSRTIEKDPVFQSRIINYSREVLSDNRIVR